MQIGESELFSECQAQLMASLAFIFVNRIMTDGDLVLEGLCRRWCALEILTDVTFIPRRLLTKDSTEFFMVIDEVAGLPSCESWEEASANVVSGIPEMIRLGLRLYACRSFDLFVGRDEVLTKARILMVKLSIVLLKFIYFNHYLIKTTVKY